MYIFTGLVASTENVAVSETPVYLLSPSLPPQTLSKRVEEHKPIKAVFKIWFHRMFFLFIFHHVINMTL